MEEPSLPVVVDDETTLPAGVRLGKYQIVRLLGAGGMGAVYEAVHSEIGKRVAIKTLAPAVAAIPGARQRFLREAQLTSRLRHPHIVDLSDMGSEGRIAFLVMELLAGEDLAHRLERTGPMPPRELADLMLPVCSALVAAHEAGIVHRDLKPHNIFLAAGPRGVEPKVLDFGISKSSDSDVSALTSTGSVIGTPHYLAPEQIKDARAASAASDQYSIGVILYRCLTGQNPFDGDSIFGVLQAIVTEKPVPLGARRPGLPEGLERVVARAMNPSPRERFGSVRELGRALLPFASPKANVIWEETFLAGASPTLPTTPERPLSLASEIPTAKAPRFDSGTLPPAVSSSTLAGLEAPAPPKRGRMIAATLLGVALAVGGFVLVSRRSAAPVPPKIAEPAPNPAPPPSAAVAAPPSEPAPPVRPAEKPAVEAPSAAADGQGVARVQPETAKPEKKTIEGAAAPARRHGSPNGTARHGAPHQRTEGTPASRNFNPNGAPVLD